MKNRVFILFLASCLIAEPISSSVSAAQPGGLPLVTRDSLFARQALAPALDFVISAFWPRRRAEELRLAHAAESPVDPHQFSEALSGLPDGGARKNLPPVRKVTPIVTASTVLPRLRVLLAQIPRPNSMNSAQLAWDSAEYLTRCDPKDRIALENQRYAAQIHIENAIGDRKTIQADRAWLLLVWSIVWAPAAAAPAAPAVTAATAASVPKMQSTQTPHWQILLISVITYTAGAFSLFNAVGSPRIAQTGIPSAGAMTFLMAAGLALAEVGRHFQILSGDKETLEEVYGAIPKGSRLSSDQLAAKLKLSQGIKAFDDPELRMIGARVYFRSALALLTAIICANFGMDFLKTLGFSPASAILCGLLVPLQVAEIYLQIHPADQRGRQIPPARRLFRALGRVAAMSVVIGLAPALSSFLTASYIPGYLNRTPFLRVSGESRAYFEKDDAAVHRPMMTAADFSDQFDELLRSQGKRATTKGMAPLSSRGLFRHARSLFDDLSLLFELAEPDVKVEEADFWQAVFAALWQEVKKEGPEVRLGVIWNAGERKILAMITDEYGLSPEESFTKGILLDEITILRRSSKYPSNRRPLSTEKSRDLMRRWLKKTNSHRWHLFEKTAQRAFPDDKTAFAAGTRRSPNPDLLSDIEMPVFADGSRRMLEGVLKALSPAEENIIKRKFGLDDYEAASNLEIGQVFHVCEEIIRQRFRMALQKLRFPVRSDRLQALRGPMLSQALGQPILAPPNLAGDVTDYIPLKSRIAQEREFLNAARKFSDDTLEALLEEYANARAGFPDHLMKALQETGSRKFRITTEIQVEKGYLALAQVEQWLRVAFLERGSFGNSFNERLSRVTKMAA